MSTSDIIDLPPADAARWLSSGDAILIDVREPDEFGAEHIAAAVSVPLAHIARELPALPIAPGRKIIFQCLKGARGGQACRMSAGTGHEVYNLKGGISGWKAAGLPVVSTAVTRAPSLFRQVQIIVGLGVALGVLAGFSGYTSGFVLAGLFGAVLAVAGMTGWCGLAMLLARMPWNRAA